MDLFFLLQYPGYWEGQTAFLGTSYQRNWSQVQAFCIGKYYLKKVGTVGGVALFKGDKVVAWNVRKYEAKNTRPKKTNKRGKKQNVFWRINQNMKLLTCKTDVFLNMSTCRRAYFVSSIAWNHVRVYYCVFYLPHVHSLACTLHDHCIKNLATHISGELF